MREREGFEFGHGVTREPGPEQRIDFFGILLTHGAQILVARLGRPGRVTHYLHEPVPFFARAPTHAYFAVFARQDHIGIGATGA